MCDLARLDHALDEQTSTCRVVIVHERRNPARSFADTRMVSSDLSAFLPPSATFTLHLGVVPSTATRDGAPLDVLVLADRAPSDPMVRVRLIGVLEADHTEKGRTRRSDHALAVVDGAQSFAAVSDIANLGDDLLRAVSRAWSAYSRQQAASFQVVASAGPAAAVGLVSEFSLRERAEPKPQPQAARRSDYA